MSTRSKRARGEDMEQEEEQELEVLRAKREELLKQYKALKRLQKEAAEHKKEDSGEMDVERERRETDLDACRERLFLVVEREQVELEREKLQMARDAEVARRELEKQKLQVQREVDMLRHELEKEHAELTHEREALQQAAREGFCCVDAHNLNEKSSTPELAAAVAYQLLRHSEIREQLAVLHRHQIKKKLSDVEAKQIPKLEADLLSVSQQGAAIFQLLTKRATEENAVGNFLQKMMSESYKFQVIQDKYQTMDQVVADLRSKGLTSCNLIVGIDFSKANEWKGRSSFSGKTLHYLEPGVVNPYMSVIKLIGCTLEIFDDDKFIPAFGFGDETTTDQAVFALQQAPGCFRFIEVLQRYCEIAPYVKMAGPLSFAPLINKAIEIVKATHAYHILLIVTHGHVDDVAGSRKAIVEASNYPLSIVIIGVGDGPWDLMKSFDDEDYKRKFDNVQFVNFTEVAKSGSTDVFASVALAEIPDQVSAMKKIGLL
eukprot:TRINITY_DN8231_c0_g2_i1.p1 TRINITY_DN8231_c0_g2~~TRINITY_DN8231_c0_g2_i1.p1  ORF type:complete len:488 (-),score=180.74 TRINITY_DN8231_c0_g2_i1:86-1549(-)